MAGLPALAAELHFGRTAADAHLPANERGDPAVGTPGRRPAVRTDQPQRPAHPVGSGLRQKLVPVLSTLDRALTETHFGRQRCVSGTLSIAVTGTASLPAVRADRSAFEIAYQAGATQFVQTAFADRHAPLRRG
jgi:hypothetical protein